MTTSINKMTARQKYEYNREYKRFLYNEKQPLEFKLKNEGLEGDESDKYLEIKAEFERLEKYFDDIEDVNVKCWIGSRRYYKTVAKFGKSYYWRGVKLTKSNGYYEVKEIEEITNEMRDEMIADSYYY